MADTACPGTPLFDSESLTLVQTPVAQAVVRTADPDAIERLDLPAACSARNHAGETAVWLGPTEWLIYTHGDPAELVTDLQSRLGDAAGYVLDTTGQRCCLVLTGAQSTTVLAHGCALDLSRRTFGPDTAAQTLLAQAGVLIHRTRGSSDTAGFVVFVRASYAHYLISWLRDAATEYLATA